MNHSTKVTLCCIVMAACAGAFGAATLLAARVHAIEVKVEKPNLKFVVVNGTIPCVISYKGGVPTAMSCKWDHIIFKGDKTETPKASWRA